MGGKNTNIFFCLQLSAEEVSLKKLIELFLSQFSDLAGSVWRGMDVCLGWVDCPKKMKKMEEKNIEKKSASVWGEWMCAWGGWTVHPAADLS